MSSQMGFYPFDPNSTFPPLVFVPLHETLKADAPSNLSETLLSSATPNHREDITSHSAGPQLLSLQRDTAYLWAWGEGNEYINIKRDDYNSKEKGEGA